jgi:hypothetical protein
MKAMRNLSTRLLLTSIIICLLTLTTAAVVGFAGEGLRHIEPSRALRQAEQDRQEGRLGASLRGFVRAYATAIEAGARWTIAQAYIDRMIANREAGQLDSALSNCGQAVNILHGFDDEGSLSYECFALEAEIQRQIELN